MSLVDPGSVRALTSDAYLVFVPGAIIVGAYLARRWARGQPDRRRLGQIATAAEMSLLAAFVVWVLVHPPQ